MITIDRINQADLAQLHQLYDPLIGDKTDLEQLRESFRLFGGSRNGTLLVARDGSKFLGSLLGIVRRKVSGDCRRFMVIESMIVGGGIKRKLVGSMLMRHIEECARQQRCDCITSSSENSQTHDFSGSLGYAAGAAQGFKKIL